MGNWRQIAALPAPRWGAAACVHAGKVYVLGGKQINSTVSAYTDTLYVYDPTGNTWTTGALLPATGLCYAFSAADGLHMLLPETGAHYLYDPDTNTWATALAAPPVARRDAHHFTDASGRFYLAGGRSSTSSGMVASVHRYDPTAATWTALTDLPASVANRRPSPAPGAIGSDGKVYVGYSGSVGAGVSVYDAALDTWSTAPSMPDATTATEADLSRLPSGIVLVLPRISSAGSLVRRVDGYDPAAGTWAMGVTPDFPGDAAHASVTTEPGGLIYLLGGQAQGASAPNDVSAQAWAYKQNEPPTVATLLTMTGGVLVSTAVKNRARHQFNDPNVGDSQSKFDWRHRLVGAAAWTTGTVASPNPWYDIAAGDLTPGNYERQILTYDAAGEVAPAWTPSGFFTAADPPAGPTILDPINGQTVEQVQDLAWSAAAQDSYQWRRVADDGAGSPVVAPVGVDVYADSGEVVDTLARNVSLTFETNGRTEHVQLRVKAGGLWSDWASVRVDVSYTPPPAPTFTVYPDGSTGSLLIMIANPAPGGVEPAAAFNRVYVDDGPDDPDRLLPRGDLLPTNQPWRYYTPRGSRDYTGLIRVEAVAANGTTASTTG